MKTLCALLFCLCVLIQAATASSLAEIVSDPKLSNRQKVLEIRGVIDENKVTDAINEIVEQLELRPQAPSIDNGDERADPVSWHPLAKAIAFYKEATPLLVKGALNLGNQEKSSLCIATLIHQKRNYGIDSTQLLKSELNEASDDSVREKIKEIVEALDTVQVIPPELRKPLEDQPLSIEEVMLARAKDREHSIMKSVKRSIKYSAETKENASSNQIRSKSRIESQDETSKPEKLTSRLSWIIAGVLLVGILLLLLKTFKDKSTS